MVLVPIRVAAAASDERVEATSEAGMRQRKEPSSQYGPSEQLVECRHVVCLVRMARHLAGRSRASRELLSADRWM